MGGLNTLLTILIYIIPFIILYIVIYTAVRNGIDNSRVGRSIRENHQQVIDDKNQKKK